MIQCLILAGGMATRMRPITESIPKALIPAGEHPFVHYQLQWLAAHGVTDVVFCIGYKGEMIRDFVGDGSRWGLRAKYVDEGSDLKGTGGAIRKALDEGVLNPEFMVTYGDAYLPVDFGEIFSAFVAQRRPAQMTVYRNGEKWDPSNVCFSNGQVTLYEKNLAKKPPEMQFIDYGILAFRRDLIASEIPSGARQDLAGLMNRLSIRGDLAGFEVTQRFYEVGSPQGLEDFKTLVESDAAIERKKRNG